MNAVQKAWKEFKDELGKGIKEDWKYFAFFYVGVIFGIVLVHLDWLFRK